MRKLGKGQSVVFCVTEEIRTKIEECTSKPPHTPIEVSHVLHWAMSETIKDLRRNLPLWAVQGERYNSQQILWEGVWKDGTFSMSQKHAEKFLEGEAQSLEARYRPGFHACKTMAHFNPSGSSRLAQIADRCQQFENLRFHESTLQEEQERELSPETQQERQVQKPAAAKPAKHEIHPDVAKFASKGALVEGSTGYKPAFAAFSDTSAVSLYDLRQLTANGRLVVTTDFARTVEKAAGSHKMDLYQRAVQWILTTVCPGSNDVAQAMIISPYEAQELFPIISRESSSVVLHVYKPRWNVGHRSLDSLDFLTIPPLPVPRLLPDILKVQLNLFAGQLYFSTYQAYVDTCGFLGLALDKAQEGWIISPDGFIVQDGDGRIGGESGLSASPVPFVRAVAQIRKNGEAIARTDLGKMLDGSVLTRSNLERESV